MKGHILALKLVVGAALLLSCQSWSLGTHDSNNKMCRRLWLERNCAVAIASLIAVDRPAPALAQDTSVVSDVTDKIYVDIKGLPATEEGEAPGGTRRIVIGLFGKDSPQSVDKLKKLMNEKEGLPAACKPKEEKMLQREQLEMNKVYQSCIEGQDKGVNYDYAQIWRIVKGERIDFGSVAGRFVARESPVWEESQSNSLKHDRKGIVSVRKGSDSGFSFTIYPGGGKETAELDDNQIVVGQVIEGLDVLEALNNVPVVKAAKVNYMGLTGGPTNRDAPTRACLYGGAMYCNENKPLVKLTMSRTGIL